MFDGREHYTLSAPHVINLFSFSKAYGMMGWRVGYLAYHTGSENADILSQIIKVQDTIPICPPQVCLVAYGLYDAKLVYDSSIPNMH
mmetsp:Transcript_18366/g.38400  ORF Transcript_18366/g.38400 Transcript_18366/m.38400 type:complete len:87 (+) Transcript_18366:938-1198(+)